MKTKTYFMGLISRLQLPYFLYLCVLCVTPFWPRGLWWLAGLFVMAPLWVLFVPQLFFVWAAVWSRSVRGLVIGAVSFCVILFGIMGFNLPWSYPTTLPIHPVLTMKVLTVNLGNVRDSSVFFDLVMREKPDVIAFQEADFSRLGLLDLRLKAAGWHLGGAGQLNLASRFRIRSVEAKDRRIYGGWGNIVTRYELETPAGLIYFFNVHLETPREGVEAVLHRRPDAISEMIKVTAMQDQESVLASSFVKSSRPALVAGDFNLTRANPLFHAHWSRFTDVFSRAGFGFGYTKHTRWHGTRIDHVLSDDNWRAASAVVGPDVGGDHHPLIVRLVFSGEVRSVSASVKSGEFASGDTGVASVTVPAGSAKTSVTFKEWSLDAFPFMRFGYRILPGVKVALRVKTSWGDWLCLGGTRESQCQSEKVQLPVLLIDDGVRHEVQINVKESVQSRLPGVKALTELQFFDPRQDLWGEQVQIDRLEITASQ